MWQRITERMCYVSHLISYCGASQIVWTKYARLYIYYRSIERKWEKVTLTYLFAVFWGSPCWYRSKGSRRHAIAKIIHSVLLRTLIGNFLLRVLKMNSNLNVVVSSTFRDIEINFLSSKIDIWCRMRNLCTVTQY